MWDESGLLIFTFHQVCAYKKGFEVFFLIIIVLILEKYVQTGDVLKKFKSIQNETSMFVKIHVDEV